jgi:hypothetical protein
VTRRVRRSAVFDENAAGSPHPIKSWFYPGALDGEAFLRPNRPESAATD